MLTTRILTALILLPGLLWLLTLGPHWGVFCLILVVLIGSVFEMVTMLQPRLDEVLRNYDHFDPSTQQHHHSPLYHAAGRGNHYKLMALFCCCIMAALFSGVVFFDVNGPASVILGLILAMIAGVFATRGIEAEMARVLGFTLSMVYAGFPWLVVWELYVAESGAKQLLLLLVAVWAGDTGGYFGGRFFGKTKLAPHKSPKKTWEGAAAGLAASMLGCLVFHIFFYPTLPGGILVALLTGGLGGITGQLGDLVESVFKRFTGVKDSGTLLPGHGGLLDRLDGVLFAAPVIWIILYWAKFNF